jgi:hypothetical protein
MSTEKNWQRALRYRKLALVEADRGKADLLNQTADEAEHGVLCTADRLHAIHITAGSLAAF